MICFITLNYVVMRLGRFKSGSDTIIKFCCALLRSVKLCYALENVEIADFMPLLIQSLYKDAEDPQNHCIFDSRTQWQNNKIQKFQMYHDQSEEDMLVVSLLYNYILAIEAEEREEEQQRQGEVDLPAGGRRPFIRSCWTRPWPKEERRQQYGHYTRLLDTELRLENSAAFRNFTRLTPEVFDEILERVAPVIQKQQTNYRHPLSAGLKLAITLRHLATGDNYRSLAYGFRCGISTISELIPEVCTAIVEAYKDEVFNPPTTPEAWRNLAQQFEQRWNVPHAVGALDGKHIAIKKPANTGSLYYNYKGFFSIPLLALVDAEYKFIWIELGGKIHMSDSTPRYSQTLSSLNA